MSYNSLLDILKPADEQAENIKIEIEKINKCIDKIDEYIGNFIKLSGLKHFDRENIKIDIDIDFYVVKEIRKVKSIIAKVPGKKVFIRPKYDSGQFSILITPGKEGQDGPTGKITFEASGKIQIYTDAIGTVELNQSTFFDALAIAFNAA